MNFFLEESYNWILQLKFDFNWIFHSILIFLINFYIHDWLWMISRLNLTREFFEIYFIIYWFIKNIITWEISVEFYFMNEKIENYLNQS